MCRHICRLVVVCAVLGASLTAMGRDVYVARDGDDANPGTKDQPLASPAKAVQLMRGVGPGTIWVGPGEYYLETGLAFDAQHAGTAGQPLVLRGTQAGQVRLTGARTVKHFRPITADEAHRLISPEARQHVVVADLKTQGFPPLAALPDQHRDHGSEEVIFGDLRRVLHRPGLGQPREHRALELHPQRSGQGRQRRTSHLPGRL